MRLKKALLAATMLSLPVVAQAQPVTGLYIGGGALYNYLQPTTMNAHGAAASALSANGFRQGGKATFGPGWGGVLALGWGFGNGLRAEVEGSYRENDVDKIRGFSPGAPIGRIRGNVRSYGVMANVLYDLSLAQFGITGFDYVQPYIGGGVGAIWTDPDFRGTSVSGSGLGLNFDKYGDNVRFAYQGIAGLAFPIASVPGLAITTEYRFLGTLPQRWSTAGSTLTRGNTTAVLNRGTVSAHDYNHSVMVGLRYALYTPPPPPPPVMAPAVAPAPARTYLVFFDWDRADLTDRARQIIADAAQNSQRMQVTRLEVSGHADRSGTPQYNQALSLRRANAVAAELVRNGVARSA
ncbi:OmpA family protein, partial [Roseomonas sp. NAR14]